MAKQQYLVQKYVMAESAADAISRSRKLPIHEVFVSSAWLEKVANNEFFRKEQSSIGGFSEKRKQGYPQAARRMS